MIEAFIYIKPKDKSLLWKIVLKTVIKGKKYEKVTSGIITTKEELRDPFDTLLSMLKKKNVKIYLTSNYKSIITLAQEYKGETIFITKLDKSLTTSFEEESLYIKEELPKYLQVRLKDLEEELKNIKIGAFFLRAYLYFLDKEIVDIPLFIDLKRSGYFSEEIQMEDIFQTIEEIMKDNE